MKIISSEATEIPVTNVEVYEWLKEKKFAADEEQKLEDGDDDRQRSPQKLKPPKNTTNVAKQLQKYFETCPSALITSESLKKLYSKLRPYKLSMPELLMISNIRPEAYAHLEPLIVDVYSRFEEQQLVEMLEVINASLEPRTRDGVTPKWRNQNSSDPVEEQITTNAVESVEQDKMDDGDEIMKETEGETEVELSKTGAEEEQGKKIEEENNKKRDEDENIEKEDKTELVRDVDKDVSELAAKGVKSTSSGAIDAEFKNISSIPSLNEKESTSKNVDANATNIDENQSKELNADLNATSKL